MPAVSGPHFLSNPDGEAEGFVAQLKSEAAAPPPSRYQRQGSYWVATKNGCWPNVTGWAEQRESQRIYAPELERLLADGIPGDEARERASEFAHAEMLTVTTARKEASDRLYARNRTDPTPSDPTTSVLAKDVFNDE